MTRRNKEKGKARAEGRVPDLKISPYRPTLNGYFIKEGDDFPYCGFPEPMFNPTTKTGVPGFEIFFTEWYPITAEMVDDEAINDSYWEKKEEDWVEHVDSETMVTLFQDMVLTMGLESVQEVRRDEPSWHCTFYPSSDPALADRDFCDKYFAEGPNPQSLTSWYNFMSKKEEDWVEHMDSETMVALFQDMVLTLGESAVEDCQDSSVHHATMPRHNWYLEDGAIAEILEEEDPDLPDSSL